VRIHPYVGLDVAERANEYGTARDGFPRAVIDDDAELRNIVARSTRAVSSTAVASSPRVGDGN
jgi:hypothetical protein